MNDTSSTTRIVNSEYREPVRIGLFGALGMLALLSQVISCCVWGALAVLGFDPLDEE